MLLSKALDNHKLYAFVDIDDTLLQTPDKHRSTETIFPTSKNEQGVWHSYSSLTQLGLLSLLKKAEVEIIPTTARTFSGLKRVTLSLSLPAICGHGGIIITKEGVPCKRWQEETNDLDRWSKKLAQIKKKLDDAFADIPAEALSIKIISDYQRDLYVSIKLRRSDFVLKERILSILADFKTQDSLLGGWKIVENGGSLGFLPTGLCKSRAVRWYISTYCPQQAMTMGIGDSLSDINYMTLCDYALVPKDSQIYATLLKADPHV